MRRLVILIVLLLVVGACGTADDAGEGTATTVPAETATLAPATTAPTTTTAPETTTTADLPGEPFEIGPPAGAVLAVIGVAHDDVLNVRAAPGTDQEILAELDPLAEGVVALGHTRALPNSIWTEVDVDGITGWASVRYLHYKGNVAEMTSFVVERHGSIPTADTMEALGLLVAETMASEGPEQSWLVMSVAPTTGDLGEVGYDLTGLSDDAAWGFRLHVFGTPAGTGFSLKSVEATEFCLRGVTPEGFCI
jgi:hypothetical protein